MSVVNIKGRKNRDIRSDEVYIGRAVYMGGWRLPQSKWHNPYSVKKYGRDRALQLFETYAKQHLLSDLEELRGKNLACWCAPEPCHGHILLQLLCETQN